MRQRIDHLEQLERPVAIALKRGSEHRPERAMGVLRAILPHARHVSFDVAGVVYRSVERWREQHQEPRILAHEVTVEGRHRLTGTGRWRGFGYHAPALRDRVDGALSFTRTPERCPIVEVRSPIPLAVP